MVSKYALLLFGCGFLCVGCNQDDPVWELPCEERPAREVIPGTGEGSFEAADEPLEIQYGDQGGSHIWFGVRLRGFGPEATVTHGITHSTDPALSYSPPGQERVELRYNSGEKASEASGMFAFLEAYDPVTGFTTPVPSSGEKVVLWAEVIDECTPEPVRGETVAEVE